MADHFQRGRLPPTTPSPQFLPSRLSTSFPAYFFTIPSTFSPIHKTQNLHPLDLDIDGARPLEKTYNCSNLGFRLPFMGIYAGWWDQGALLLLSFRILYLQKFDALCTERKFDGGILWCYGEKGDVPSRKELPANIS